jgi:hypothetical protein
MKMINILKLTHSNKGIFYNFYNFSEILQFYKKIKNRQINECREKLLEVANNI